MLPTDAMTLLAAYTAAGVPGLTVNYPADSKIVPPTLNLFWEDAELFQDVDPTRWEMTVRGQILVGAKGVPEAEMLRVEQLIAPIADVFTTDTNGSVAYHLEDRKTGDRVDYCFLSRATASQEITVANIGYYGAELFFRIGFRRIAGSY
jgi:hypothetical protein